MATATSGTLTANTVATVTVTAGEYGVTVTNRAGTGEIWVRLDGTNPTVAGGDCFLVMGSRNFPTPTVNRPVTVKLISTGTPDYTVEGRVSVA